VAGAGHSTLAIGAPRTHRRGVTTREGTAISTLGPEGQRAATVVWLVVNAVCVLQAVGFATRPVAPEVNQALGLVMAVLAIPSTWALVVFVRVRAGWRHVVGPVVYDAFIVVMVAVDDVLALEWRDPVVPAIQIPYLVLFFGAIVLMGAPMFRIDRRRWLVTVATASLLIVAMLYAMAMGVG